MVLRVLIALLQCVVLEGQSIAWLGFVFCFEGSVASQEFFKK